MPTGRVITTPIVPTGEPVIPDLRFREGVGDRVITTPIVPTGEPVIPDLRFREGVGNERFRLQSEIQHVERVTRLSLALPTIESDDPKLWTAPYRNLRSLVIAHRAKLDWARMLRDARFAEQQARERAAQAGRDVERWVQQVVESERFDERATNTLLTGLTLALSWGAAGAGIGLMVAGPGGALIGGVIGAVAGFIVGVVLGILPLERWEFRRRWQAVNSGMTRWERFFFYPSVKLLMDRVRTERCGKAALPPLRIAEDVLYTVFGCVDQLVEWVYEDAWDSDPTPPGVRNELIEAYVLAWCAAHHDDEKPLQDTRSWNVTVNEGKGPHEYVSLLRYWARVRCGDVRAEAQRRGLSSLSELPMNDEQIRREFMRIMEESRG